MSGLETSYKTTSGLPSGQILGWRSHLQRFSLLTNSKTGIADNHCGERLIYAERVDLQVWLAHHQKSTMHSRFKVDRDSREDDIKHIQVGSNVKTTGLTSQFIIFTGCCDSLCISWCHHHSITHFDWHSCGSYAWFQLKHPFVLQGIIFPSCWIVARIER